MQLQQVDRFGFQARQRTLEFGGVGTFELGGDENPVAQIGRRHFIAHDDFRIAVS